MYRLVEGDHVGNVATISPDTVVKTADRSLDNSPPTAFSVEIVSATLPSLESGEQTAACESSPVQGPPYRLRWTPSSDPETRISEYQVFLDGIRVASVSGSVTEFSSTTLRPSDGAHAWRVDAVNGSGRADGRTIASPSSLPAELDSTKPTATAIGPMGGYERASATTFSWTASDARCLARVQVKVDGVVIATVGPTVSTVTRSVSEGSHTWQVVAIDSAGNSVTTNPLMFTASNAAPANQAPPTIVGGQRDSDGRLLAQQFTSQPGAWTGPTAISYSYRWQRCTGVDAGTCFDVGAGSTYDVSPADIGARLKALVTGTTTIGTSTTVASALTDTVACACSFTAAPTVVGTAEVGKQVTIATASWEAVDGSARRWRWQRCDATEMATCDWATAALTTPDGYTLQPADEGRVMRVVESLDSANVSGTAVLRSVPTEAVIKAQVPPVNVTPPVITGGARDAHGAFFADRLTANAGTWNSDGDPVTFTYRWEYCDQVAPDSCQLFALSATSGATNQVALPAAAMGRSIRVLVTAQKANVLQASATSDSLDALACVCAVQAGPVITGSPVVDQVLNANAGTWTPTSANAVYGYQWLRCDANGSCSDIEGATGSSYRLVDQDAGAWIGVLAGPNGTLVGSAAMPSSHRGPVVLPAPQAPSLSVVTGSAGVAAHWPDVTYATSYAWTCTDVTGQELISSGTAVAVGDGWRSDLCPAAAGHQVRVTVTAQGPGGIGSPTSVLGNVNRRPSIELGFDSDGPAERFNSRNGATYANGTYQRDVVAIVRDPDDNLATNLGPDPAFEGLPGRPSQTPRDDGHARVVVEIRPPVGRPAASGATVVLELNTNGALLRMVGGQDLDAATVDLESQASGVCVVGDDQLVATSAWSLDCSEIGSQYVDGGELRLRLPLRAVDESADQSYTVAGWVRDQRQPADYRFLASGPDGAAVPDQPYTAAAGTSLGSIVVDRVEPDGTLTTTSTASDTVLISVEAAHDVLPASFDASGLESVEMTIVEPDGSTFIQDAAMSCSPLLPRSQDQSSSCSSSVVPVKTGEHRVSVRLIDGVGNHRTLEGVFAKGPVAPAMAPSVSVLRATNGVVAKWAPLADATGYRWKCDNVTRNTSEQGTATQFVGGVVRTPVCTGAGSNPAGTTVRVTVTPFNEAGDGPASAPMTATIDARPSMSLNTAAGFNPDGGFAWAYSKSGRVHSNGSRNREIFVRALDPDGDLTSNPVVDPDLNPGVETTSAARARFVARVSPPATSPAATTAHVIVQLGPNDGSRLVRLIEGPIAPGADSLSLQPADADTCAPGQVGKKLVGQYWEIDCERILLVTPASASTAVDMRIPLFPRVAADGSHLLPDQTYVFSGYVRDVRQPADGLSLTHSAATSSTDYSVVPAQTLSASLMVDRLDPTGTVTAERVGPDGARKIQVSGVISSTTPSASTNPSTISATALSSARVTIDRITGPSAPERIVTDAAATCAGSGVSRTCSYTSVPLLPMATYRTTMAGVDQAGNVGTVAPIDVEFPAETSTEAGYLDPAFGHGGIAITDFAPHSVDAADSVALDDGTTITVGTRYSNPGTMVLTAHTSTGQLDPAFGTGGIAVAGAPAGHQSFLGAHSITKDSEGRLLVGAASAQFGGPVPTRIIVARFLANGTLDTNFGTAGYGVLAMTVAGQGLRSYQIQIDPAGRIVLAGYDENISFGVARFLPTGAPDTAFANGGYGTYRIGTRMEQDSGSLAIQSDGKILVGGTSISASFERIPSVVRLNINGTVDTSYGNQGWFSGKLDGHTGAVRKMAIDANDAVTFAFWEDGGSGLGIGRLTSSGTLDTAFGSSNDGVTITPAFGGGDWSALARSWDVVLTDEGTYVVLGHADQQGNTGDEITVGRFEVDGTTDAEFGRSGINITSVPNATIKAISAVQINNGDIVVSGTLTPTTGTRKFILAAYLT